MEHKITISIAKEFSITPGSRYKVEGDYSGEDFRERLLEPAFQKAVLSNSKLVVDLDGTLGYGTSFLEEVFGGLARKHGAKKVLEHLEIISDEEDYITGDVIEYIENAEKTA